MTGGKSRPKKDRGVKVCGGEEVGAGQILVRGFSIYKRGKNVGGLNTLYALCLGKAYFSKKKTSHGKTRTFVNVMPSKMPKISKTDKPT